MVELDITGKSLGNEGLAELAAALVTSIEYTGEHGKVVKLEELCLRDNKFDVSSLPALSQVVKLAACDLRDLDVSNNLIGVSTDEEAQVFQDFLRCFADCCVLRRLDLSGNTLGPKAFEMLAKVYGQEEPIDLTVPESQSGDMEHDEPKTSSAVADSVALGRRLKNISMSSDSDEYSGEANSSGLSQVLRLQDGSRKGLFVPM